jgi:hypothetical protein
MIVLSLQEAVERTATSKVDIWRAIQAGMPSARKTDDGGFAIEPIRPVRRIRDQTGRSMFHGRGCRAVCGGFRISRNEPNA